MDRTPRHHAMVDFQQHCERRWVVLEEDHEKALAAKDARIAELKGVLCYVRQSAIYDNTVQAERIDAVIGAQQQDEPKCKTCDGCGDVHGLDGEWRGYCDCAAGVALRGSKSATPSEDGGEVAEVVAWMWRDINGDMQFNYMHPEGKPLMTVAQHDRIVAAKDAEIARLGELLAKAHGEIAFLKGENRRAQPARQVGDDWPKLDKPAKVGGGRFSVGVSARLVVEAAQRQYEYDVTPEKEAERIAKAADLLGSLWGALQMGGDEREYHCDYAGCSQKAHPGTSLCLEHHTPKARAALAPAAVVMPGRKHIPDFTHHPLLHSRLVGFNEALDEVARLNRNPIPVGLLERLQHYVNHCDFSEPEWNGERELLQDELRALLGKDGEVGNG